MITRNIYSLDDICAGVAPGIFRQGGLTLPMRGLKYGFQGIVNAKNFRQNSFHLPTGASLFRQGGYSPL